MRGDAVTAPAKSGGNFAFHAYRWLSRFAEVLPQSAIPGISRIAGSAGARLLKGRRSIVTRNLTRVLGRVPEPALVRKSFASYVRYWLEALRLPVVPYEALDRRFEVEGLDRLVDARARGNGVILALPHLGNWDVAGYWLVNNDVPLTVVAERVEPPKLHTWFTDFRTSLGFEVLVNGPAVSSQIISALHANKAVALLCDRDVDGSGTPTEFFGEQTRLPRGPATLALRTGAALIPAGVYETPKGYRAFVGEPVSTERRGSLREDVERVSNELTRRMEEIIRKAPEQWHLFGPNWPSDAS